MLRQQFAADDLVLGGHCADDDLAALETHPLQFRDAREIDEMGRRGEAEFHHRNEAVAAGDHARLGIKLAQEGDRFREVGWPMILERSGDQDVLPLCGFVAALGERGRRGHRPRLQIRARRAGRFGPTGDPINDG